MLRTSLRAARTLGGAPAAARGPWVASAGPRVAVASVTRRYFADGKKPSTLDIKEPILDSKRPTLDSKEPFLDSKKPSIDSKKPSVDSLDKNGGPIDPTLSADATPKSAVGGIDATETTPPPTPTPIGEGPPKKGILKRLRNLIYTLTVLGALGFGGGVWYSRVDDKFHDLFVEYIPLGEHAVLYLEELDFRKRFPDSGLSKAEASNVTVPASSGASWRVADHGLQVGRRSSAVGETKTLEHVVELTKPMVDEPKVVESPVPVPSEVNEKTDAPARAQPPAAYSAKPAEPDFKSPEVNEPSRCPPLKPIDPLGVEDAREPVVQDLVRMINDLITVINADEAHGRYGTTVTKVKDDVAKVGRKLKVMRAGIEKEAAEKVKANIDELDKAARMLVDQVDSAMATQERTWRQEFEGEMERVRENYDEKVRLLLERERELHEERTTTKLLEQAVALRKGFFGEVEGQVEKERDGRLGKLDSLSSAVKELEALTTGWNDVVDANIRTQHLHVAVQAVRASLEDESHPRPFVKELVALKQIADGDAVVDAAIASINPGAYQKGVPTAAQLVDRFRRVAGEVRKASLLPDDAGVASHATSWALSKVMFKKEGLVGGDDVESVLGRAQMYLEEGDLDSAAREVNGLEGWAKTLSGDWLGEVRKVLEVRQALEVIATEARLQSLRAD